ncbi:cellulase family glycosylhydrolase [Paenibacillus amylolyticus]|uniref:Endoglucanase n=1 Tax=Paenibacillus amylolyticus TaxID=1451 RepID=A0A124DXA5_PAEAM|nr:cellulase family glycosylhydrolase [Paenibacillus amylolyticus]GAS80463.1 endoglucanase [Paenibacillus amylolyticus]
MKRIGNMFRKAMLFSLSLMLVSIAYSPHPASAASGPVKGFHVSGTKLLDATGTPFVMRGVNHAHTWFKNDLQAAIPAIAATGSNTVRIVLSNGSRWTADSLADVEQILALCDQYQLTVMLEVHDATGSDSIAELRKASDYFISIKDALIGKEDRVIVNIANEWYGSWETAVWADGYQQVIPELRQAGIKNTLVVDTAGWGQYPTAIFNRGLDVFNADPLANTIFSIHMYEYAGGDAATVKSNIDHALAIGVPVIVGEFGFKHTSGDVDEATILSYAQQKGVGWLAWSWYGNGGGVEYLDLNNGPAGSLTDWGQTVVNGPNGTLATSALNTIYTTPGYQPVPDNGSGGVVTIPAAPTGVTATPGNGQVALNWSASPGAASYIVQRATTSGGTYTDVATNVSGTTYTNTSLTNGTTYYYKIKAVNSAGSSPSSVLVSATPQAGTTTPTSNLVLQYRAADTDATNNHIKPYFNIKNNGTSAVNLSGLKIRYYFTKDGSEGLNTIIDWAQIGAANITTSVGSITGTNADTYVEIGFTSGAGSLPAGGQTGDIQLRIHKDNWGNFNENNDYSFRPTQTTYDVWNRVTLHQNGNLISGITP